MTDAHEVPPRVVPKLRAAPKIRQLYWCDFPKDAQLPEFWKRRPVIILSKTANLHGTVTIVPCSTQHQTDPALSFKLRTTIDGKDAWAICDKITTMAVSRLLPDKHGIKRLREDEFHEMLKLVLDLLPKLPSEPSV